MYMHVYVCVRLFTVGGLVVVVGTFAWYILTLIYSFSLLTAMTNALIKQ